MKLQALLTAFMLCSSGIRLCGADAPRLLPFQGRLTDGQGDAVADGARVVQFKIYDAPVGGSAVWNGEVQKLTVNSGLVSTTLGTKASLGSVNFNQSLYLELTVDANGDNQITAADPPLLPRQSILPAVFAKEAADSRLLAGFDWSAVFDNGNPLTGFIAGNRLAAGSIQGLHLADQSVSGAEIANGTITSEHIAVGGINSTALGDSAVTTAKLADGSVTVHKLASRPKGQPAAPAGGIAISPGTGVAEISFTSNAFVTVEGLGVSLETRGRPVKLFLAAAGSAASSYFYLTRTGPGAADSPRAEIQLKRNALVVGSYTLSSSTDGAFVIIPSSAVSFLDGSPPDIGQQTYSIEVRLDKPGVLYLRNMNLVAHEL
jgi:hypothetical protein